MTDHPTEPTLLARAVAEALGASSSEAKDRVNRVLDGMLVSLTKMGGTDLKPFTTFQHERDDTHTDLTADEDLIAAAIMLGLTPARTRRLQHYTREHSVGAGLALRHLIHAGLASLPNRFRPGLLLRNLHPTRSEVVDQVFTELHLHTGSVLYGYRSDPRHVLYYSALRRLLPAEVTADTYQLAVEVEERWAAPVANSFFPPPGGITIEGGCYTGLKAMKWAEQLGAGGVVIAVEIDPINFELLTRNIKANALGDIIRPVCAGIWSGDGTATARHSTGRRNFLHTTDQWQSEERLEREVSTLTFDTIINQQSLDHVDYINVQVNGAELQALRGLRDRLDDVKVLGVAAYYTTDGVRNADLVKAWADEVGWTVARVSAAGRLMLVNPRFAQEVEGWDHDRRSTRAPVSSPSR